MAIDIGTKVVIKEPVGKASERIDIQKSDQRSRVAEQEKEDKRKAELEEQRKAADANTLNETKGKVISESRDGDTVRASEKSMEALNDGMVLPKGRDEEVNNEQREKEAEQAKEVQNLNGYSEQQLDALYREGKITLRERDEELKDREELKEAAGMATDESKKAQEAADKDKKTETRDTAVNSNNKNEDEKTNPAVDNRENNAANETKTIEKENEAFNNFERTMNNVISVQAQINQDPDLERFGTVDGFNIVTK